MITLTHITKSYGTHKALNDISFELKKGEVVGFLGPNGAGKTTTMRILTGYLPATSGECTINGKSIFTHTKECQKVIGYLPESNPLYLDMIVYDMIEFAGSLKGVERSKLPAQIKKVSHVCGLQNVIGQKVGELSKGYKQRVGLACALIHEPEVLILDEPTVGLDPNQIIEIRSLIREIGASRTVLLSSHILSEVEQTCDRVMIISKGNIVASGTPKDLSQNISTSRIHLILKGGEASIKKIFSEWKRSHEIQIRPLADGLVAVTLIINEAGDLREEIFNFLVNQKQTVLEFVAEKQNLEQVFRELTV